MNFQGLGKIETYEQYLDMAFKKSIKVAESIRSNTKSQDRIVKSRRVESARVITVAKSLISNLDGIIKRFPSIDHLPPFYNELVHCTIDYELLKKSLGALNWAKKQLQNLLDQTIIELRRNKRLHHFNVVRTSFSGRASSVMKQIKKNLEFLEGARKIMKSYPALKTSVPTIVIAGMPNVGKSTLLAAITGAKPHVASYPFTTQKLNLGYDAEENQYIDTPGLLDRPIAKRNPIERQAILALKHVANLVVFIIDPTESCGYPIGDQEKLLADIKKQFAVPVIIVSNKTDLSKPYPESIAASAKTGKGIDAVRAAITSALARQHTSAQNPA